MLQLACQQGTDMAIEVLIFKPVQAANTVQAAHPDKPRPDVTALAKIRTGVAIIPTSSGNQLVRLTSHRSCRCKMGIRQSRVFNIVYDCLNSRPG